MNPLTIKARYNVKREQRIDNVIAWGCGLVFAVLTVSFFL